VIAAVRARYPEVILIAEAYWDLEWELQQQGFDFCYDKRLYDRLARDSAESVRLHLLADLRYQERLIRFIENHDEPRAYGIFGPERSRAAAVTVATLPGAKLFHEGQLEGRRVKLPVQLGRRPAETADPELQGFYSRLLEIAKHSVFRDGDWRLCERSGWPDNASYLNLLGWCRRRGEERWLIVVNLSGFRSQACVRVPWDDLAGQTWRLSDAFSGEMYEREGSEMLATGLFVDLAPWGFHCLRFARE
jgi:glycosidase